MNGRYVSLDIGYCRLYIIKGINIKVKNRVKFAGYKYNAKGGSNIIC
jgi:hypothetical protein